MTDYKSISIFKEANDFLFGISKTGIKLGLDTVSKLLNKLDNPHRKFKSVLVAGTNGKGSVCAMLNEILIESGFKTGLSISPHLVSVTERIKINNIQISEERFTVLISKIKIIADQLYESKVLTQYPTYFEFITAAALFWFYDEKVDIAVLEIGMGGRFDAFNIVDPILSIITDIDIDHTKHLGKNLTQIAGEKAGIIRDKSDVVISVRHKKPGKVIEDITGEKQSNLHNALGDIKINLEYINKYELKDLNIPDINNIRACMEDKPYLLNIKTNSSEIKNLYPGLTGRHQLRNISAVLKTTEILKRKDFDIKQEDIVKGIQNCYWPARLEWINWKIPLLFDGAHNPAGIRTVISYITDQLPKKRFDLVFAVKINKDYRNITRDLFLYPEKIYLYEDQEKNFIKASKIINKLPNNVKERITVIHSLPEFLSGYEPVKNIDYLLITGSLYLIGEIKSLLNSSKNL